jgi:DNA-binding transcriptional LysR family regulator
MIDLRGTDLNLLVSLDALIEEANVTRAAARLNVSQPALSAQLARLRQLFHDPLLVSSRSGRGMIPTARALELKGPLQLALKDLENIVKRPPVFDPSTASRTFAIAASDNATVILGVGFIERIRELAGSDMRVSFQTPSLELIADQLEHGEVDLLIGSERMIPKGMKGMKARTLFHDHYLMAQRKGHPRGGKALDLESYCGLSHLLVSTSGGSFHGDIDEQLEKVGRRRRVALSIHQFSLAPIFLRATDYVATLPARFVRRFTGELEVFDLPFKARGYSLAAVWHPRNDADPGHSWLRGEIGKIAAARHDTREGPRRRSPALVKDHRKRR